MDLSIFTEDIKNTRFLLTMLAVVSMMALAIADLIIIVMQLTVTELSFGLLQIITGATIALANTAYNSYFKDRQAFDQIAAETSAKLMKPLEAP